MAANRLGARLVVSAAAVLLLASHVDGRWHRQLAGLPGDTALSFSYSFSFDMEDDGESPIYPEPNGEFVRLSPRHTVAPNIPVFVFAGERHGVRFGGEDWWTCCASSRWCRHRHSFYRTPILCTYYYDVVVAHRCS